MVELRFELFAGSAGLDRAKTDWKRLTAAYPDPGYVHLWEWHRAYLSALARRAEDARYGVFYDGSDPVAIFPLQRGVTTVAGVSLPAFVLPHHDHLHYADVIVRPEYRRRPLLAALERELTSRDEAFDVFVLGPVLADSATSALVASEARVLSSSQTIGRSDALETKPYEQFLDGLSKNFRGSLRKARNKLAKHGAAVHVPATSTSDELPDAFEQFLVLEASGWKGRSGTGTAIALDPALRSFYGQLVERLGPTGAVEINVLVLDTQPIAAQLAITSGRRCYVLKIAYDETHAALAPGNMLLERLLQKYGDHAEIRHVDLVSSAAWHTSWNPIVRDLHSHLVFRRTARGLLAWSALRSKEPLRRIYRHVSDRLQQARGRSGPSSVTTEARPG
jgi:hypothetical protein